MKTIKLQLDRLFHLSNLLPTLIVAPYRCSIKFEETSKVLQPLADKNLTGPQPVKESCNPALHLAIAAPHSQGTIGLVLAAACIPSFSLSCPSSLWGGTHTWWPGGPRCRSRSRASLGDPKRAVLYFSAPVPHPGGRGTGAVEVFHDVSRERELREGLLRASQAKSAFLTTMSHELRTPLNAILGFSELLQMNLFGELNPKQAGHLGTILDSGRHLLSLIDDILDLPRVERGEMDLQLPQMDGLEATRRLKANPQTRGILIYALNRLCHAGG